MKKQKTNGEKVYHPINSPTNSQTNQSNSSTNSSHNSNIHMPYSSQLNISVEPFNNNQFQFIMPSLF